jgi:hypothetical protein
MAMAIATIYLVRVTKKYAKSSGEMANTMAKQTEASESMAKSNRMLVESNQRPILNIKTLVLTPKLANDGLGGELKTNVFGKFLIKVINDSNVPVELREIKIYDESNRNTRTREKYNIIYSANEESEVLKIEGENFNLIRGTRLMIEVYYRSVFNIVEHYTARLIVCKDVNATHNIEYRTIYNVAKCTNKSALDFEAAWSNPVEVVEDVREDTSED